MKQKLFASLTISFLLCGIMPSYTMEGDASLLGASAPNPTSALVPVAAAYVSNAFEIDHRYSCGRCPDIYLKYTTGIDTKEAADIGELSTGFKIFRTSDKRQVGYLVANYIESQADIRIGAVWIKEEMRRKGYCSQALTTFMAQCLAKKVNFPEAQFFSFYTETTNSAMIGAGRKAGFLEETSSRESALMLLFGGVCFKKSFC